MAQLYDTTDFFADEKNNNRVTVVYGSDKDRVNVERYRLDNNTIEFYSTDCKHECKEQCNTYKIPTKSFLNQKVYSILLHLVRIDVKMFGYIYRKRNEVKYVFESAKH